MEKMIKIAKVLDVLAKIVQIFCIIALIFTVIGCVAAAFIPKSAYESLQASLVFDITVKGESVIDAKTLKSELVAAVILAAINITVCTVLMIVGIWLFRKLLKPMQLGRPFEDGISGKIIKFGHFILIGNIAGSFLTAVLMSIINLVIKPSDFGFDIDISLDWIIIAVIVYLVGYIFRYGEELQKQADETV